MTWTKERISALKTLDVQQLRLNAEIRGNSDIASLCDEVLASRPLAGGKRKAKRQHELDGRPLVSRSKAFQMRGVKLRNPRWSWGGMRESDGIVVFTIWKNDIEKNGDTCRYELWGPNRGGNRPWSETPGGRERLEHCRII